MSNGLPDDHSKVVPLLPIPNRTVKRLSADDSADARVKVGHRQAFIQNARWFLPAGVFFGLNGLGPASRLRQVGDPSLSQLNGLFVRQVIE